MVSSLPALQGLEEAKTCWQSNSLLGKAVFCQPPLAAMQWGLGGNSQRKAFFSLKLFLKAFGFAPQKDSCQKCREGGRWHTSAKAVSLLQTKCGQGAFPWVRSAWETYAYNVNFINVVFLLPQQVTQGQPPVPQQLAGPDAKHQQKCGQQDACQQPGHLCRVKTLKPR